MKLITTVSRVWIVGLGSDGQVHGLFYDITALDVARMRDADDHRRLARGAVARWIDTHAADLVEVYDYRASLEVGGATVEIPWTDPEYAEALYQTATEAA